MKSLRKINLLIILLFLLSKNVTGQKYLIGQGRLGGATDQGVTIKMDLSNNSITSWECKDDSVGYEPNYPFFRARNGVIYGCRAKTPTHPTNSAFRQDGFIRFDVENNKLHPIIFKNKKNLNDITKAVPGPNNDIIFSLDIPGTNNGCVARYDYSNDSLYILYNFSVATGLDTNGYGYIQMELASDGNVYGSNNGGGKNGKGAFFKLTMGGVLTKLFDFSSTIPNDVLTILETSPGILHIFTGGLNYGRVYKYTIATNSLQSMLTFGNSITPNGFQGNIIKASNGKVYGFNSTGTNGSMFSLDLSTYTMTTEFSFTGPTGAYKGTGMANVMQLSNGTMYGVSDNDTLDLIFSYNLNTKVYKVEKNFTNKSGALLGNDPTNLYEYTTCNPAVTLTASFTGKIASAVGSGFSDYQWYLNGKPILGATSSSYTASVSGSYTVNALDSNKCYKTSNAINFNAAVSNIEQETAVTVYPNPSSDFVEISSNYHITNISLYDLMGRKMPVELSNNKINLASLLNGSYFIIIKTDEGTARRKFEKN